MVENLGVNEASRRLYIVPIGIENSTLCLSSYQWVSYTVEIEYFQISGEKIKKDREERKDGR